MICENCKTTEASGFIEEAKGGVKKRIYLCSKCLLEKQKAIFGGISMFPGFAQNQTGRVRCSACGTELKTVLSTLFTGCPLCYSNFRDYLGPVLKSVQGATAHTGAIPDKTDGASELNQLAEELSAAVREERYEDAAAINRRIKLIKEGRQ